MLKENAHRGQGVVVLSKQEALRRAISAHEDGTTVYEMAQAYLGNQYTIAGRRFYFRRVSALSIASA